jgi:predicted AAA+ superfamily ATPase
MDAWKQHLKGVYDTKSDGQSIMVTGSARLETFRRTGESLAGRYYHFRLHPLSVKELAGVMPPYEAVETLNRLGGFPEPFLSGSDEEAARWRKQYYTDIIRDDVLEFGRLHEIRAMRFLVEMLRSRVGSPVSYNSLAEDLQISPNTVRRYIEILEALYIVFAVRPYHRNIARSIIKEPKLYFFDSGFVLGDEGVKYENTVAVSLLKHVNYLEDSKGEEVSLHYLRTRDGQEADFAIAENGTISNIVEVKLADTSLSRSLAFFKSRVPQASAIQIVHNARRMEETSQARIVNDDWLADLSA